MQSDNKRYNELKTKALAVADAYKLFFIEDVVAFMPCSKSTFYNHKLHELEELKELITRNRVTIKVQLRKKWAASELFPQQMALYKLVCSEDERMRLSMAYQEISDGSKGDMVFNVNIIRPGEQIPTNKTIDITEHKELPPGKKAAKDNTLKTKAKMPPVHRAETKKKVAKKAKK